MGVRTCLLEPDAEGQIPGPPHLIPDHAAAGTFLILFASSVKLGW